MRVTEQAAIMTVTVDADIKPVPPQPDNDEADEKDDQKNLFKESVESLSVASVDRDTSGLIPRAWAFITWTPKRCRWDPENPPPFSLPLNLLFGFVSLSHVLHLLIAQFLPPAKHLSRHLLSIEN